MRILSWLAAGLLASSQAWAVQVAEFVPQGVVADVRSVQLEFDEDMVPFGDGQWPAPLALSCTGQSAGGAGRWLDARRWTYVFDAALPAGVQCQARLSEGLRSLNEAVVTGPQEFTFSTGAPRLVAALPYASPIDEDQVFVLQFNGPVDVASLLAHSHCAVEGIGELIALRALEPVLRGPVLDTLYDGRFDGSAATQLVQCARVLPPDARVRLQLGPGIASLAGTSEQQAVTQEAQLLEYQVRPAFSAELSCPRENARAPCMPLGSIGLRFSSPVPRAQASAMRLRLPDGERRPELGDPADDWPLWWVRFAGPFPANTDAVIEVPAGLRDDAGRPLENAGAFPLAFHVGDYPPLVKFASDSFGVVERFAAVPPGASEDGHPPTLALSLRNVEADLLTREIVRSAGVLRDQHVHDDAQALHWFARVQRMRHGRWPQAQADNRDVRSVSLLTDEPGARRIDLPGAGAAGERPFEVVGVPVPEPGLHVLEIESPRLGEALLADRQPMFVRTLALVTNLSVHFKVGRDDALVWVTTLDDARPVPDARVGILDCRGEPLAGGRTDSQGLFHVREVLPLDQFCEDTGLFGLFASARIEAHHPLARGKADYSFVFSAWDEGIEPWRFRLPLDMDRNPTRRGHTVLDRSLYRPGETVSMKHFLRAETREGLALPQDGLPQVALVQADGMQESQRLPLLWQATPSGGLSAYSRFVLPPAAALGLYRVRLSDPDDGWYGPGVEFRVEEFRLPVFGGALQLRPDGDGGVLVAPGQASLDVQVNYLAGGPAAGLPVSLSAMTQDARLSFPGFDGYSFARPALASGEPADGAPRLFLDKQALRLDGHGAARVALAAPESADYPQSWTLEASLHDFSGELQTLVHKADVWPAQVHAGIRTQPWVNRGEALAVQVVALGPDGLVRAGVPVTVTGVHHQVYTTRKRLVGGFYSYDNQRAPVPLGVLCEGLSGPDGRFECGVQPQDVEGSLELVVTARDALGGRSSSAVQTWVSGSPDAWFPARDDDRIDLVPARPQWVVGETAEFQVHMPFREATALISVEREGVLQSQVRTLRAEDPVIRLPVQADWAPNVYVSVLVLRGRLRSDAVALGPSATVDLARPAWRFGVAPLHVSGQRNALTVELGTPRTRYQTRDEVTVDIRVSRADGQPAAHGSVAFVAVDQALLELAPNGSWDLRAAMYPERGYGVHTATAQMQVVGLRHYGRKAAPAGGGGGKSPTRELLDSLLSWQPDVRLDEQGRAQVSFRLNDAISRFALVAVADHGSGHFGTGRTDIVSARDLYLIANLPVQARQGDEYLTSVTLRNTTGRSMPVVVSAQARQADGQPFAGLAHGWQDAVTLAPGGAQAFTIPVVSEPAAPVAQVQELGWTFTATEHGTQAGHAPAQDALHVRQTLTPRWPVQVQQASSTVLHHRQPWTWSAARPAGALVDGAGRVAGGVQFSVAAGPQASLDEVKRSFRESAYGSLQQKVSRALGLADAAAWADLMKSLPAYLDSDGLATWFTGMDRGDEVLTAFVLIASDEARALGDDAAIPDASREAMLDGLAAFVEGRIVRHRRAPVKDRDMRKLMALDALSRYRPSDGAIWDALAHDFDAWPTSSLIDALSLVQGLPDGARRRARTDELARLLRARTVVSGQSRVLADSQLNSSAWLMAGTAVNQARLVMASLRLAGWENERQALLQGLTGMQRQGDWGSSPANLFGVLALRAYEAARPFAPLRGDITIHDGGGRLIQSLRVDAASTQAGVVHPPLIAWEDLGDPARLSLRYQGSGSPWVTAQALAAVPRKVPVAAGLRLSRALGPLWQAMPGQWTQGDTYRVRLSLSSPVPRYGISLFDAIPTGARILGARSEGYDQAHVSQGEAGLLAYFDYLPAGTSVLEYEVRLNAAGVFFLPPATARAVNEPDIFALWPVNERMRVQPGAR